MTAQTAALVRQPRHDVYDRRFVVLKSLIIQCDVSVDRMRSHLHRELELLRERYVDAPSAETIAAIRDIVQFRRFLHAIQYEMRKEVL